MSLRIQINPKVFLQGPFLNPATTGLMNDILREDVLIPATSPYADGLTANSSVFNAGGTSGTGSDSDNIVDWVWVELRDEADPGNYIQGKSALLQRDGDVVALDGLSALTLFVAPKNYYVVIKHRNHLGAMSSATMALSETSATVDFTNSSFSTYGTNAQVQLASGDMALWAGDTNDNGNVKFSGAGSSANVIKDHVLADPANGFNSVTYASLGYLLIDVDLNGVGKFSGSGSDSNIIKDNVLAHPGNGFGSVTYTINTTVPPKN